MMQYRSLKRRHFLKNLVLSSAALTAGCSLFKHQKRPNILFLFTDDQRHDTIHALGNKQISTPNMDTLVKTGVSFKNAYIMNGQSAAVCMPSRAMLLTGRSAFHLEKSGRSIPKEHVTLPEYFKQNGYITYGTGKWHNGKASFARSFDRGGKIMFGGMSSHYNIPVYDFDPSGTYAPEQQYQLQEKHSSRVYADEAIRFVNQYNQEEPFFMYVAFQAPHDPREMPQRYLNLYDPQELDLPPNFMPRHPFDNGELYVRDEKLAGWPRSKAEIKKHLAAYYAMITHLDDQIGRILKALQHNNLYDNTLVILAGDNGLAVGQHGLMGKQNCYEHSLKVPLIFSGPGVDKNKSRNALCYIHDLFPTLCSLLGLETPDTVESKSLAPCLKKPGEHRSDLVFAYKNFQRALRHNQWKLICYNVKGKRMQQLFNLADDPWEINNLADKKQYQGVLKSLKGRLQTNLDKAGDRVVLKKPEWGVEVIPAWGD